MGKPLMIQEEDDRRIVTLKKSLGVGTKVAVVRAGLDLLEQETERAARRARWRHAARLAAPESRRVNREFRAHSRLRRS